MDIYTPVSHILCSCIICREIKTARGILHHHRLSHTEKGKLENKIKGEKSKSPSRNHNKTQQQKRIDNYNLNPKKCLICENIISYENRHNKCCSRSCSAIYSNKGRVFKKWTQEQKERNKIKKLSLKMTKSLKEQKQIVKLATNNPEGMSSKICYCSCSHCKLRFTSLTQKKYCCNCDQKYSHDGRAKYWFTFNIFHYPDLFDLSLITTIGFRDNKTNPNGITRDHKISVNEAIRNNYDPYYIKHPLNCELMRFDENNKKKTKCSISYNDLVSKVQEYDKMVSGVGIEPTTGN